MVQNHLLFFSLILINFSRINAMSDYQQALDAMSAMSMTFQTREESQDIELQTAISLEQMQKQIAEQGAMIIQLSERQTITEEKVDIGFANLIRKRCPSCGGKLRKSKCSRCAKKAKQQCAAREGAGDGGDGDDGGSGKGGKCRHGKQCRVYRSHQLAVKGDQGDLTSKHDHNHLNHFSH
jgi:hypothetical protein